MTRVQLLEREVKKLDRAGLLAFREWFAHYDAAAWDEQFERDARAGKLEKLSAEALSSRSKVREI